MVCRSSLARSAKVKRARACSRKRRPASVGSAPRPLRYSRCWPSSSSSRRTCRLSVGCATSSISAAREKLRLSATHRKYSICLRSIGYLIYVYLKSKI
ncbi:hypothetical protein D3C71_1764420 [compost metagenome]